MLGFTARGRKKISEKDVSSDSNSVYSSAVQKVSFFIYVLHINNIVILNWLILTMLLLNNTR